MGAFVPLLHHYIGVNAQPTPLAAQRAPVVEELRPSVAEIEADLARAFADGRAEASREAGVVIAALEQKLAAASVLADAIGDARKAALVGAGDEVAALVVALARRIVGDALAMNPDALPGVVVGALARIPDEDEVWIRVHPSLVDQVRAIVPERHRSRVTADPAVATGCIVETKSAGIDATLEAAFDGVEAATRAWLAGRT